MTDYCVPLFTMDMPTKKAQYDYPIDHDTRLRVDLVIVGSDVANAAIALEYEVAAGDWRRVVCIDNYGGRFHRDRYTPHGRHAERHERLFHSDDINLAIEWAKADLVDGYAEYIHRFRETTDDD